MTVRLYDSARKVMAHLAIELLQQTPGAGPVLDLGCGPGLIANWLGERQGRPIHGLDIGARSIAAARAQATGQNCFKVYDGIRIPYPDGHFDAVLCLEVIEHVEGDREMLTEIRRVLRPGGRLLLSTTNAAMVSLADKPHHVRHYTAAELLAALRGAGLTVDSLTYRYHPIGYAIDRALLRLGAGLVATEQHDDEALTVASRQPSWIALALTGYGRVIDPLVTALVCAEYEARRTRPGGSLMIHASQTNPVPINRPHRSLVSNRSRRCDHASESRIPSSSEYVGSHLRRSRARPLRA